MKTTYWVTPILLALATTVPLFAGDEKPPQMDEKAAMEMMMKLASPGEMHKKLDPLVGTFDTKVTMWMAPGAPAQTSSGTSKNAWVLGGRYLSQTFDGKFMDMPFSGQGYTGYDNIRKQYFGIWMDNMGTGVMVSEGSMDSANSWSFSSKMPDPMSGAMMDVKEKVVIKDNDHHSMEMWIPAPDGKPFKTMEIEYSRAKR